MTIVTIIVAILIFSLIVIVHELGHFLVGRAVGIKALAFSVGMGPTIFQKQGKETKYAIKALPIGGSVQFLGEDAEDNDPRAMNNVSKWRRFLTLIAGPAMNILLGIILIAMFAGLFGIYEISTQIADYNDDYFAETNPAKAAGLLPGDKIIGIDGIGLNNKPNEEALNTLSQAIVNSQGEPLLLEIQRDDQVFETNVTPVYVEEIEQYQIGIIFEQVSLRYGFFKSIWFGVKRTGDIIVLMVTMLWQMIFKGQGVESVTGPVGIFNEIGKAVNQGIEYVINLTIIITLNLGIINLLPIPALDGGRIVFLGIEAIKGSPLNREREGMINFIGFALLMLLMLLITYRDITNLF